MKFKKKTKQVFMISISVLLAVGTIFVCIIGEKRFSEQKYKKYSGAREVNSYYGEHNKNEKLPVIGEDMNDTE